MKLIPAITEEEVARAEAPLEQAYTLPKSAYTSSEVYETELNQVLRKSWISVAHVSQLPESGSYVTFDLLGQPAMVVRGQDEEIRVMSSVCLHRGASVAEACGRKNLFTCPYHAWSYDTTGQLVRAPLMEGAVDFSEAGWRLPIIRSEIWNGFILANLDEHAEPLAGQIEDFTGYFANFGLTDMKIVKTVEYDSGWNWKVLVENFMEAYHHIAIHSKTFEPRNHARDSTVPENSGPWSILHMPLADSAIDPNEHLIEGREDWQSRDLFANVIFPYFIFAVQGEHAFWYQISPQSVDRFLLKIHVLLPKHYRGIDGYDDIVKAMAVGVKVVHEEDIRANDLVWTGLTAPMTEQGRLSPLEKSIWQMNQWWLQQMRK